MTKCRTVLILSILTVATLTQAATKKTSGPEYCYEDMPGGEECHSIIKADVQIFLSERLSTYVSVNDWGENSCFATADFAKKADLSLVELRDLILNPNAHVLCKSNPADAGQEEVYSIGLW